MFESITSFLSKIQNADYGEWIIDRENDGTPEHPIQMPFVAYTYVVREFENTVYRFIDEHKDMELNRYGDILSTAGIEWGTKSMEAANVASLDGKTVMAMIVGAKEERHMAKKKADPTPLPAFTKVKRGNYLYLRAFIYDSDGKRIAVYGKNEEELAGKILQARKEIEDMIFRKANPTVSEYCERWLEMQAAHVRPSTLRGYTLTVRKYIIAPLGEMYLSEVTADDIKLAMVPVSKRSEDVYNKVNMLFKSIFYSAEYSNLIKDNPAKNLNAKGGIPKKEKEALTDAQAEQLLDTIKDLPPYVFVMIGLYSGLRREEILALQWDCVHLEGNTPYISVRRAWHSEKNRPVVSTDLKTPAAKRDVPIPENLADCLRKEKEKSISEYVIADRSGQPLSYSQFVRIWNYIKVRSTKERTLYKYVNGQAIKKKFKPEPGQKCVNRENIVYSLDFTVTPHQLRHTYITNLIYAGIDPKTVQYLAGHENSKVTMDIYAKAKYNKPEELSSVVNSALKKPVKSESGAKTGQ